MLNFFDTGDESYRLADARDRDVGWIRGSAIGFDGLPTESDALAAAAAGADALAGYLERITGAARPAHAAGAVHVVHDGAYEWVARGRTPLARLYRPERDRPRHDPRRTFGVEFVLPSYVKPGAAIGAAQVVHRAIAALVTTVAARSVSVPSLAPTALADAVGVR